MKIQVTESATKRIACSNQQVLSVGQKGVSWATKLLFSVLVVWQIGVSNAQTDINKSQPGVTNSSETTDSTVIKPESVVKTGAISVQVNVDDIIAAFECSRDPKKCSNSSSLEQVADSTEKPTQQAIVTSYDFDVSETIHSKID